MRSGMMIRPPPTPTKPLSNPAHNPIKTSKKNVVNDINPCEDM